MTGICIVSERNGGEVDSLVFTHPELAEQWDFKKNATIKPDDFSAKSTHQIWWLCPKSNHSFRATIRRRTRHNVKCPHCARIDRSDRKSMAAEFPEVASQWHFELNGQLQPTDVLSGSKQKVWWHCPIGHAYQTRVNRRVRGRGLCTICRSVRLAESHPELSAQWHPTLNGNNCPSSFKKSSSARVWWMCTENPMHEWEASILSRAYVDSGCPHCRQIEKSTEKSLKFAEKYPQVAAAWHMERNNNVDPATIVQDSTVKHWWRCNLDSTHEWTALIRNTIEREASCPLCPLMALVAQEHTAKLSDRLWHPTKNPDIKPFELSVSAQEVWWQCRKNSTHREWKTLVKRVVIGHGCPDCAKEKKAILAKNSIPKGTSIAEQHPELAIEFDPVLNKDKSPSRIRARSQQLVWWRCQINESHSWADTPHRRTVFGKGCLQCKIDAESETKAKTKPKRITNLSDKTTSSSRQRITLTFSPLLLEEWHYQLNGARNPLECSPTPQTRVWWCCKENPDHVWKAKILARTNGAGCPYCNQRKNNLSTKRISSRKRDAIEQFSSLAKVRRELAREWHWELNVPLTPRKVSAYSDQHVGWICRRRHTWTASVRDRVLNSQGCPMCFKMDNCLAGFPGLIRE